MTVSSGRRHGAPFRAGRYQLNRLVEKRGSNAKVIDWLDEITADCPKKIACNMNDPCGAR
jgi:hypothetical protein